MIRPPPSCTLTDTLFPYKTLCRSRSWWWGGGTKATWGGHVDDDGCDSAGSGAQVAVIGDPARGSRPLQDVHDAHGAGAGHVAQPGPGRSEEHTSELQSLMRISYAVFCLKKKKKYKKQSKQTT